MKNTIYTVVTDWMTQCGDSDVDAFLFSNLDGAKEYLREVALSDLESHRGEDIFFDEELCDNDYVKELRNAFDDDFNAMNREGNADWIVEANPTYYSCYKQGRYSDDHFNVRIIERVIDELPKEKPCDHFNARPIDDDGWSECFSCRKLLDTDGNVLGFAYDYDKIKFETKEENKQ